MFDKLSAPFPHDAVSWRAQQLVSQNTKALALAYIDARDVMRRLDEVCGPENWQDSYAETPKGRLICTIQIRTEQGWVSKSDGAGDTDVEGEKGAISDAFKRCAVKWGVGRYLYETDTIFAPCEVNERNGKSYWKKWKPEASRMFSAALDKAANATHVSAAIVEPDLPSGPINDATRDWLQSRIDARHIPVGELCQAFNVPSLKAITYEQVDDVKTWLRDHQKAAA